MDTFTLIHVAISLIAIVAGFPVVAGLLTSDRLDNWTAVFLVFTTLTSVTGFFFPFHGIDPAIIVGIISCVLLAAAIAARYLYGMRGIWRPVYIVTAVMAFYLNFFVLVVQSFQKIGPLHGLAPKGSEPPFAIAQGVVLVALIVLGYFSVKRFHPPEG